MPDNDKYDKFAVAFLNSTIGDSDVGAFVFNGDPIYVLDRPQEVKFATCSADKSRKLLNYQTKTTLKDAVIKTCDYIKQNGVKEFKYHLPVEIINDKTPETWVKKLI